MSCAIVNTFCSLGSGTDRFQYHARGRRVSSCVILEAIRAGVGLGLGPRLYILRGSGHETSPVQRRVGLECYDHNHVIRGHTRGVAAHHQVQSSGRY